MITAIQACKIKEQRYQKDICQLNHVTEVLTPEGDNPSLLRNHAAHQAKGEILLFLDDDSSIDQDTLDRYREHFLCKEIDIIGGPAVIRNDNPFKSVV